MKHLEYSYIGFLLSFFRVVFTMGLQALNILEVGEKFLCLKK